MCHISALRDFFLKFQIIYDGSRMPILCYFVFFISVFSDFIEVHEWEESIEVKDISDLLDFTKFHDC